MGEIKETAAVMQTKQGAPIAFLLGETMFKLYWLVSHLQRTVADETKPWDIRCRASEMLAEIRWMCRGEG